MAKILEQFRQQQLELFEALKDTQTIPELAYQTSLEFVVSSFDETIGPIIKENDVIVITGAYFGDEGKGKLTDAIARDDRIRIVFRANSGENAGHTVFHEGNKYVFNLTPSGIMVPGKVCAIGPECVMDPINFMKKEVAQLIQAGVDYKERLVIGNVHLVGPHHKVMDFALSPPNSSTLMGISYAHASKARKHSLRLNQLFNDQDIAIKKLKKDLTTYHALIREAGKDEEQILEDMTTEATTKKRKIPQHLTDFLKANDKVDYILSIYQEKVVENPAFPIRGDVIHDLRKCLRRDGKVLSECPQSYWLSNATGKHFSSATSPQTHAAGVVASSGFNLSRYRTAIINGVKTPGDSRVGIGENPSSFVPQDYFSRQNQSTLDELGDAYIDFDAIQKQYFRSIQQNGIFKPTEITDSTGTYHINEAMAIASSRKFGEKGATTGKPRITGIFDCVAAAYVMEEQGPYLFISAMDRGDDQDFVGLTVAYIFHNPSGEIADSDGKKYKNGDIIKIGEQYPTEDVLRYCHPIVKVMQGWKDTPIGAGKRNPDDPLPKSVQNFLGTIEDLVGNVNAHEKDQIKTRIIGFGNGQDTKNVVYVKRK